MEEVENKIKDSIPQKAKKVAQNTAPKKSERVNRSPAQQRKEEKTKPAPPGISKPIAPSASKPKPFEAIKKPIEDIKSNLNNSKQEIADEVPYSFDHNKNQEEEDAPKPAAKFTKPFGGMNNKTKPAFGKMTKPFGNATNASNAGNSVNESRFGIKQEEPKPEPPKQEPVSFTEKYGLAKKEEPKPEPTPIQPQAINSSVARGGNRAPWERGRPGLTDTTNNATGDYIPTVGGGASSMPRRVGQRPEQNISSIPTIGEEKKTESVIDRIPVIGDTKSSVNQINSIPRMGGARANDQIDSIPVLGSNNNSRAGQVNKIPTIGESRRNDSQIDSIPTIGDRNAGNSRVRATLNNDNAGYVPSGIAQPKPDEDLAGGRRRVADPFSKFDNVDPLKSNNTNKPFPFGSDNVSRISNNSNNAGGSLFQSNKNDLFSNNTNRVSNQPGFMDRVKQTANDAKEEPKKTDFWGGILNEDKAQPVSRKPVETKPAPKPAARNNVNTFNDVADLEDEFILD